MSELRVVLADDHEVVRAGLRVLVNSTPGLRVVGEARTGQEAVDQAHALRPHVVVMDVSMPLMDGAAATQRICAELPEVRVVALTAHDDASTLDRLLQAGAAGYVLKRLAASDLIAAVRAVGAGQTYVDPALAGAMLQSRAQPGRAGSADPLTEREEEVLRHIAWGRSNKEIATELGISVKTVETHKARATEKLGLRGRTELVRYAVRRGWMAEG